MNNPELSNLNVSLENHLIDTLRPLPPILPIELATALNPYLNVSPPTSIPYSILNSISRWSRTNDGLEKLHAHSPPLDPQALSMISLLAGVTTSPERKLGLYIPAKGPAELEAERIKERKSITALLNALLSIGGSGVATWWIAEKTGWKNEWSVLLSLFVAIVVAVSEAILYIIWQSRRSSSKVPKMRNKPTSASNKKDDGDPHLPDAPVGMTVDRGLRRRL